MASADRFHLRNARRHPTPRGGQAARRRFCVCTTTILAALLALSVAGSGEVGDRPLRVLLFDFEGGVDGWLGNPWGGGRCGAV